MRKEVVNYINSLDRRSFTNNTQRVLFTLLTASVDSEGWVPLSRFRVNSAGSRIRDLRKGDFGGFDVVCRSASRLERRGGQHTFYYRVNPRNLTVTRLRNVFGQ